MPTQLTSFTRPTVPTGTGQSDPLVNALLKQALNGPKLRPQKNNAAVSVIRGLG